MLREVKLALEIIFDVCDNNKVCDMCPIWKLLDLDNKDETHLFCPLKDILKYRIEIKNGK